MKRATSFRVRKRDGRTEWLRASKLARSIGKAMAVARGEEYEAMHGSIAGEEWRSLDLASAVLTGLRRELGAAGMLTTERLAEAVQQVFVATGLPRAAETYARCCGEQRRRQAALRAGRLRSGHAAWSTIDLALYWAADAPPRPDEEGRPGAGRSARQRRV